jgi:transposase
MVRSRYPSDLTDAEWAILAPVIPAPKTGGHPPQHERRDVVIGIRSAVRGGIAWRAQPHDLPPWQAVSHEFRLWRLDGTWQRANATLRAAVRRRAGHSPTPAPGRRANLRLAGTRPPPEYG